MIKQGRNVIIDSSYNDNEVLGQDTALARQCGYDYNMSIAGCTTSTYWIEGYATGSF